MYVMSVLYTPHHMFEVKNSNFESKDKNKFKL